MTALVRRSAIGALLAVSAGVGAAATEVPPIGAGPAFHPGPTGRAVRTGDMVAGLSCSRTASRPRLAFHLELFARREVVLVPAGIGFAPPLRGERGRATAGRCVYALRTEEPTGVVLLSSVRKLALGSFFAVWGQPLSRRRLAGFRTSAAAPVLAFVDGRRWLGDPRAIPLREHAEIVLEIGGYLPPHVRYRFPKGVP